MYNLWWTKWHWEKPFSKQWYKVKALNQIKIHIPVAQVLQDTMHQTCLSLVYKAEDPQVKLQVTSQLLTKKVF
jgi:hypothetical protein